MIRGPDPERFPVVARRQGERAAGTAVPQDASAPAPGSSGRRGDGRAPRLPRVHCRGHDGRLTSRRRYPHLVLWAVPVVRAVLRPGPAPAARPAGRRPPPDLVRRVVGPPPLAPPAHPQAGQHGDHHGAGHGQQDDPGCRVPGHCPAPAPSIQRAMTGSLPPLRMNSYTSW